MSWNSRNLFYRCHLCEAAGRSCERRHWEISACRSCDWYTCQSCIGDGDGSCEHCGGSPGWITLESKFGIGNRFPDQY